MGKPRRRERESTMTEATHPSQAMDQAQGSSKADQRGHPPGSCATTTIESSPMEANAINQTLDQGSSPTDPAVSRPKNDGPPKDDKITATKKPTKPQTSRSRPKKKAGGGVSRQKASNKKTSQPETGKKRKRLQDIRKEQQQLANKELGKNGEVVVAASDEGMFFEIEKVVGERTWRGKKQYRVRWKGIPPDGDTWEPISNLCDTAYDDAKRFTRERNARLEASERFFADTNIDDVERSSKSPLFDTQGPAADSTQSRDDTSIKQPELGNGDDVNTVNFEEVGRIDVHGQDAKERVTNARVNGIPIILVGRGEFTHFASRWLKPKVGTTPGDDNEHLDLSRKDLKLDIDEMISDIGQEFVTVSKTIPGNSKPVEADVLFSAFLVNCWKNDSLTKRQKYYVNQWQFGKSDIAVTTLCAKGRFTDPISGILGEDLRRHVHKNKENAFQYISMGGEGISTELEW